MKKFFHFLSGRKVIKFFQKVLYSKENRNFATNLSIISMELTGKIIAALTPRSGTSARTGNKWMSQEFVIETHEQYPRKCVFRVFGEDRLKEMNIQVGAEMTVSFDIDAHEYQGRWFNDISAWRAVPATAAPAPEVAMPAAAMSDIPSPAAAPAAPANEPEDDLPF